MEPPGWQHSTFPQGEALPCIPGGDGEAAAPREPRALHPRSGSCELGWAGRPGRRHICWAGGPGIRDIVFLAGSAGCQKPDKLITSDMGQSSSGVRSRGPPRRCCCRSARIHQAARLPRRTADFWEGAAAARVGLDHCGPLGWQHSSSSCLCLAVLPPDITCFGAGPGWVAAGSCGMRMDLGFVQLLAQQAPCSEAAGVLAGTQSPGKLCGVGMCGRKRCRAWQGCSCWRSKSDSCGPSAQSLQAGVLCWEFRMSLCAAEPGAGPVGCSPR